MRFGSMAGGAGDKPVGSRVYLGLINIERYDGTFLGGLGQFGVAVAGKTIVFIESRRPGN